MVSFSKKLIINLVLVFIFSGSFAAAQENAAQEKNEPKNYVVFGLVVDTSGSTRTFLETMIQSVEKIARAKQPDDEGFLVRFVSSEKIRLLVPKTRDEAELISGVDDLYPEGGQSAIADALHFAAKEITLENCDRLACKQSLILISDGEERESRAKATELLDALRQKNIRVYAIRLVQHLSINKEVKFLQNIATQTGGKAYYPKNADELNKSIEEIMRNIRK